MATFDIQGREGAVFESAAMRCLLRSHAIERLLVGTHGAAAHRSVLAAVRAARYIVRVNASRVRDQPDGLIVAVSPRRRSHSAPVAAS